MKVLMIDCSCGMNIVAVNGEKEASFFDETQTRHSDDLITIIDKLLADVEMKISEVLNICVCVGPGSFTGVRVALSVCKGLAIGTGAKVCVASNFDVYEVENIKKTILILEGFSENAYVRIFNQGEFSDACLTFDEIENLKKNQNYKLVTNSKKVQKRFNLSEKTLKNVQYSLKNVFLKKIQAGEFVSIEKICPVYLRASQAEIERNKKLAGETSGNDN